MKQTIHAIFIALLAVVSLSSAEAKKHSDIILATPSRVVKPVAVDGLDLITKVYGAVDPGLSKCNIVKETAKATGLLPQEDEYGLWLDSEDGYIVNYKGMCPRTSAMATFNGEDLEDFSFFFIFPYSADNRNEANALQCAFCGSLLQELADLGLDMHAASPVGTLFEADSEFAGNRFNIRLVDSPGNENSSARFIVIVSVDPASMQALNAMR